MPGRVLWIAGADRDSPAERLPALRLAYTPAVMTGHAAAGARRKIAEASDPRQLIGEAPLGAIHPRGGRAGPLAVLLRLVLASGGPGRISPPELPAAHRDQRKRDRDRGVVARAVVSSPAPTVNVAPPAAAPPAPAAVQRPSIEPLVAAPPPKAAPAKQESSAPPAPTLFDGRVLVRSTPAGARVFVDGRDRGQTPATIVELGRGEHRVRVVRDGYTSAERRVVLSDSRPSQLLSVPLARDPRATKSPVPPKPNGKSAADADVSPKAVANASAQTGAIAVESRPQGALVLIDGRIAGTTPLSIGDVRAGNHTIRIEHDGYRAWTSAVTVNGGDQNRVTASLEEK